MITEQNKKQIYKNYIQEAVANLREQDLLKLRLKEIKDAAKESGFDPKEFGLDIKTAYDISKIVDQVEALEISIESVKALGL